MLRYFIIILFLIILGSSCTEQSFVYEVNDITVLPNNAAKDKLKTQEQFISILYANLYQKALSPNQLVEASEAITSIGDKRVAFETIVAKFIKDPEVIIPSNEDMRMNIDAFLIDTYKRFYVRLPTEAEKKWMTEYIESRPNMTPELIYYSFATSDEYYYY